MTNEDLLNIINFLLRQNNKGDTLNVNRFNALLIQECFDYFKEMKDKYEESLYYQDILSPFVKSVEVSTLTTSTYTITVPSFYAGFVGMYYEDDDGDIRAFDLVIDDQWDIRINSTLGLPTDDHPICKIGGDKIYVYPYFTETDAGLPIYYGSGSKGLSASEIQALSNEIITEGNKRYSYSPNMQVYYVAYPAIYGELVSVLDTNGYETISDWTLTVINFTVDTVVYAYNVYEFNNLTTQTNFYNKFKF